MGCHRPVNRRPRPLICSGISRCLSEARLLRAVCQPQGKDPARMHAPPLPRPEWGLDQACLSPGDSGPCHSDSARPGSSQNLMVHLFIPCSLTYDMEHGCVRGTHRRRRWVWLCPCLQVPVLCGGRCIYRWMTAWQCTHCGGGMREFRSGGRGSQGRLPGGVIAELAFEEFRRREPAQPGG